MPTVDASQLHVKHNAAAHRFEVQLDDKGEAQGVIEYHIHDHAYVMTHTGVPKEYGGQGVADKMTHDALEMVKAEGYQVVPQCPFVAKYIQRHPEYQPLVAPDTRPAR